MQIPKLICFDVGARNGLKDLKAIAPYVSLFGFEPNVTEKDELQHSVNSSYLSFEVIKKALYSKSGNFDFYIMENPSMSSFLLPDESILDEYFNSIKEFKTWRQQLKVRDIKKTEATTIDEVVKEKRVDCIDYLKLDTQGTELDILRGAQNYINEQNILVIKTEFAFIPLYKGQAVFTDIDLFLRAAGYKLITCEFKYDINYPFSKYSEAPKWGIGGDAYYCLDFEKHSKVGNDKMLKTAIILAGLGFVSNADYLFNLLKIRRQEQLIFYSKISKQNKKNIIKYFVPPFMIAFFKKIALKKSNT